MKRLVRTGFYGKSVRAMHTLWMICGIFGPGCWGRACLDIGSDSQPYTPAQHDVVEVFVAWALCRVEQFVITGNVACTEGKGWSG